MLPCGITELLSVAAYEVEILSSTKKNVFDYYEAKIHKILKACKYQNVLLLSSPVEKLGSLNVGQHEPCRCLPLPWKRQVRYISKVGVQEGLFTARLVWCSCLSVQLSPRVVFLVHIVQSQSTQASNFSDENKLEDTFQIH